MRVRLRKLKPVVTEITKRAAAGDMAGALLVLERFSQEVKTPLEGELEESRMNIAGTIPILSACVV